MATPYLKTRLLPLVALAAALSACENGNDSIDGIGPLPVTAGDTYALTSGNRLISFNRAAPATARTSVSITGLAAGETLIGIDFRPADGLLYGVAMNGGAGRIYSINTLTGVATPGMALAADPADSTDGNAAYSGLSGAAFGVDFNPVPDRLRVVSDTGQNLRINLSNGLTITDIALTGPGAAGVSATAYTNSFSNACRTTIYYLDTTEGLLLTSASPNAGVTTSLGALRSAAGAAITAANAVSAFEISSVSEASNTAYAVLTIGSAPTLYTVDLATGVATSVGAIAGAQTAGEQVRGLAMAPPATLPAVAAGEIYGLTESNKLISFNRAAPGKLCSSATIAPLVTGEQVVGIDFRPSTGVLHGLGNASGAGRLLTINPATAAVTASEPLPGLVGTDFGMDFNPTGPVALRIVSDTGQNLRITGIGTSAAVNTDTALNGAGTSATAAAYTNSVAGGPTTTALWVIDTSSNPARLMLQGTNPSVAGDGTCPASTGNPNCGVLSVAGDFTGLQFQDVNGFDIDGRDNLGLLAASPGASATSTLYSFAPGVTPSIAVTALGAIGGGEKLRGLTRPTPATTVLGLTDDNTLVPLSLTDPTVLGTAVTVSPLSGENLIGIDFRPGTGVLYGVGDAGGLFTINPSTGAATRVSLAADMADMSAPLAALGGSSFGVDFNPAPASVPLRIVSNTEQNLRVGNIATGATFTDAVITAATSPNVHAAAYLNSFASPSFTALLVIDAATGSLAVQGSNPAVAGDGTCPASTGNPNCGILTVIGALSASETYSMTSGFDIAGGANGLAIAALQRTAPSADVTSRLYRINLSTGAASPVLSTAMGGDTGVLLRGLAIRVQ